MTYTHDYVQQYCGFPANCLKAKIEANDPKALAFVWIDHYVDNLNDEIKTSWYHEEEGPLDLITVDELIETARSHMPKSKGGTLPEEGSGHHNGSWHWPEYIVRRGVFEGTGVDPKFWECYATLFDLDVEVLKGKYGFPGFFSCSC